MTQTNCMIILDRDGILNHIIKDSNTGELDSPMQVSQAKVFEWVPHCLKQLNDLGYKLVIATNQPSAAKGKTTQDNLKKVHTEIIKQAQSEGAKILRSYICFHKKEDGCSCRKPAPGLLKQAYKDYRFNKSKSWMVGDRGTDVLAGKNIGVKTALLLSEYGDGEELLKANNITPTYTGTDLRDFLKYLI